MWEIIVEARFLNKRICAERKRTKRMVYRFSFRFVSYIQDLEVVKEDSVTTQKMKNPSALKTLEPRK